MIVEGMIQVSGTEVTLTELNEVDPTQIDKVALCAS